MKLTTPVLARVIPSDPYRSVVLVSGSLILAECNGSSKNEVSAEIAKRINFHDDLVRCLRDMAAAGDDQIAAFRERANMLLDQLEQAPCAPQDPSQS